MFCFELLYPLSARFSAIIPHYYELFLLLSFKLFDAVFQGINTRH